MALPYVAGVAAIHPWWPVGVGSFLVWPLLGIAVVLLPVVGGGVLYARAAAADGSPVRG